MAKKILFTVFVVLLFLLGLLVGRGLGRQKAEAEIENIVIDYSDCLYNIPSCHYGEPLDRRRGTFAVAEKIKINGPTAVALSEDMEVWVKAKELYFLKKGDCYKFMEYAPDGKVVLEVNSDEGKTARLELPREGLIPVDEGEWLRLTNKEKEDMWLLNSSIWYSYKR